MLYQLSYASPAKLSEDNKQATQLQAPSAPTQANWRPTLQPQREYTTSTSQIQHSFRLGTAHVRFEMHDRPKRPSAAWKDLTKRERMAGGATSPMKRAGIISIFAVL